MKLVSRILLATDFDESSVAAVPITALLAGTFGSEVIPLHVLRDVPHLTDDSATDAVRRVVDRKLQDVAARLEKENVSVTPPILANGQPFEQILNHANARDVNVIVMGAGGSAELADYQLGVTPQRVIRRSSKPVWIVRPGARPEIGRIVCAVDFSAHSRRALTNAIHLARKFKAELFLLTVVEPLEVLLPAAAEVSSSAAVAYAVEIQERLEALRGGHDTHDVKIEDLVRKGRAAEQIIATVQETKADLLVMGSSGSSGFVRFFIGSVADKVLRRVPCSMLTLKSEDAVHVEFEADVDDLGNRLTKAQRLLDEGLAEEAVVELESLRSEAPMTAPLWEALAVAHERLGNKNEAVRCAARAKHLRDKIWLTTFDSEPGGDDSAD